VNLDLQNADETQPHDETEQHAPDPYDDTVEVRRDGPLSAVIGGVAAVVALAYLLRSVGSGDPLDWALCLVTLGVTVMHVGVFLDSRAPLMLIDRHGIRLRRGRAWEGLSWYEVERVEHTPRMSLLRDGALTVLDSTGRAHAVRLSLSTRLIGANWHELTEALEDLSEGRSAIVELHSEPAGAPEATDGEGSDDDPTPPTTPTPPPGRPVVAGQRAEVVLDSHPDTARAHQAEPPVSLDEPTSDSDADSEAEPGHDRHDETQTMVIDPGQRAVIADAVIGPELAAARTRLGLGVVQLAERTRIRAHVIESIEVDDFGPCGGDFYARGHLRTLARVLGIDAEQLVAQYDDKYADAPIDPRCVFEAELATSATGTIRGTRGGVNWSVLVASVMAVVLVWSVARLVMDGPSPISDRPVLNGSPGGKASLSGAVTKVPVSFTAATGGARVIVRDGRQQVVFDEDLAFMQTAELSVAPPVRISSSDGGLTVVVDGTDEGALGATGQRAQQVFVP